MPRDPYKSDDPLILPSILSADFAKLGAEIGEVMKGGADLLHLDVMDGHFVPNISFGPPIVEAVREVTDAFLDVHLMIEEPLRYIEPMRKAGADGMTFHVEVADDPAKVARRIRETGAKVGIALNPGTRIESVFPALKEVDLVLVMSVQPGFSGQSFKPEVLEKVRQLKPRLRPEQRIEIDGGIDPETAVEARAAGVDWFVAASAIFKQNNRKKAIANLRQAIK